MANEKRLIDANEIKYHTVGAGGWSQPEKVAYDYEIDKIPTVDAVEVVRCRECEHFTEGMAVGMCKRIPDKTILPIPYDHFCSFGERKRQCSR